MRIVSPYQVKEIYNNFKSMILFLCESNFLFYQLKIHFYSNYL